MCLHTSKTELKALSTYVESVSSLLFLKSLPHFGVSDLHSRQGTYYFNVYSSLSRKGEHGWNYDAVGFRQCLSHHTCARRVTGTYPRGNPQLQAAKKLVKLSLLSNWREAPRQQSYENPIQSRSGPRTGQSNTTVTRPTDTGTRTQSKVITRKSSRSQITDTDESNHCLYSGQSRVSEASRNLDASSTRRNAPSIGGA